MPTFSECCNLSTLRVLNLIFLPVHICPTRDRNMLSALLHTHTGLKELEVFTLTYDRLMSTLP